MLTVSVRFLKRPVMQPAVHRTAEVTALRDLIAYIEMAHHDFTRDQLARIAERVAKLLAAGFPLDKELQHCVTAMEDDLIPHLMKEERILFPYISALEQTPDEVPYSCFGSVANPIRMMQAEHVALKAVLERIRALTSDYHPPCADLGDLYVALSALDDDLMQHMHQEDDVLFPKALQREQSARR